MTHVDYVVDHAITKICSSPDTFTPALKAFNGGLQLLAVVRNVPVLPKVQQVCDTVLDVFLCIRDFPNGIKNLMHDVDRKSKWFFVTNAAFFMGTALETIQVLERWQLMRVTHSVVQVARTRFITPLFVIGWSFDFIGAVRTYTTSKEKDKLRLTMVNDVLAIAGVVSTFALPTHPVLPMSFYVIRQICNCAKGL